MPIKRIKLQTVSPNVKIKAIGFPAAKRADLSNKETQLENYDLCTCTYLDR